MVNRLLKKFFVILLVGIMAIPNVVHAFPPLPSSYYGLVTKNGINLPEGVIIEAVINNRVYASNTIKIYEGDSVYSLVIPGDDPATEVVEGGVQGDTINFHVDGVLTDQTAAWLSGSNTKLDLTLSSDPNQPTSAPSTIPSATPTRAPTRTSTSIPTRTPTPVTQTQIPSTAAGTSTLQMTTESAQILTQGLTSTTDQALTSEVSPTLMEGTQALVGLQGTNDDARTQPEMLELSEKESLDPTEPVQQAKPSISLTIGLATILLILLTSLFLYFRKNDSTNETLL